MASSIAWDWPATSVTWWGTYLLAYVLSQVFLPQAEPAATLSAWDTAARLAVVVDGLSLLATILAFRVVAGLDRLQWARLAGAGTQGPACLTASRAAMPPAVMPMSEE